MENWTKEEDDRLIAYIKAHGEGSWQSLPEAAWLLRRSGESCRLRWIHFLKRGNFTDEEEELIIRLHSLYGNKRSQIAGRLAGRTNEEVRNYWNAHIRRKLSSRGIDPYTHRPIKSPNHHSQRRPTLLGERKSATNSRHSGNYRGVWKRPSGRWVASICDPRTHTPVWLGTYATAEEADLAYDEAVLRIYGSAARLNFPHAGLHAFKPFVDDLPRSSSSHLSDSEEEVLDVVRNNLLTDDPSESKSFVEFHWISKDRVEIITKPDIVEAENDLPERHPPRVESVMELPLDQQPDSGVAERIMFDLSPPRVESTVTEEWLDSSYQQAQQALDEIKIFGASVGQDNTSSSSKKGAVRRLEEEYGIDCNTLHQYSDKKLEDVAPTLGGLETFDEDKGITPRLSSSVPSEAEEPLDPIHKDLLDEDPSESKLNWNSIARGITVKPVVEAEKDVPDRYPPTIETTVTELRLDQPADIGEAERNVCDQSPPPVTERRVDSSSQQPQEVLDDIDKRIGVRGGKGTTTSKRKKRAVKLDEAYGIDYNTLHQYSDKKQKDAAFHLGVSLSTLKRICRKHNILRWPPRKTKIPNGSLKESIQATEDSVEDHRMELESVSNLPCLTRGSPSKTTTLKDGSKIMVKVLYKDGIIIKFEISLSSTKLELEEKVAFRLNLRVGSFSVKYEDEEKEWVLVACDEDLRTCINTSKASGKPHTIRMIVSQT